MDGRKRSRHEMHQLVFDRFAARNGFKNGELTDEQKGPLMVHVDRMYRGGTGDDNAELAVIFPKDAEYYAGVIKFLKWWESETAKGVAPVDLYETARRGKNDLTQPVHQQYADSLARAA